MTPCPLGLAGQCYCANQKNSFASKQPAKTAVLLLAHGSPENPGQIPEFLSYVTGGRQLPPAVVEEIRHRYSLIGFSPLACWTLLQSDQLSLSLKMPVFAGMRNWKPFIGDAIKAIAAKKYERVIAICLAPQNSRTSTGLYKRALDAAVGDTFPYDFIAGWADETLLAEAFAERLAPVLAEAGVGAPILFTAHSVPCRTIRATTAEEAAQTGGPPPAEGIQSYGAATEGDPYPIECKQTAAAVAKLLNLNDNDWYFAFQSQGVAGAPWIGPTVEDTLKALAEEGHKAVIIQPIGFLCDHVEILYDIDVRAREVADGLGVRLERPPALNDDPRYIATLVEVIEERAAPWLSPRA